MKNLGSVLMKFITQVDVPYPLKDYVWQSSQSNQY